VSFILMPQCILMYGNNRVTLTLINLLKKTTKLEWTKRCKKVIQELKQRLTITPILTLPVESKAFTIYSDTLKNDLGSVLMQKGKVCFSTTQAF